MKQKVLLLQGKKYSIKIMKRLSNLNRFLLHKLREGEIDGLTSVCASESGHWTKLIDVPELKDAASKIAEEEEIKMNALQALDEKSQVFVPEDDMINKYNLTFAPEQKVSKKSFRSDAGVKYMWDEDEQEWVEDDDQEDSEDEEGGQGGKVESEDGGSNHGGTHGLSKSVSGPGSADNPNENENDSDKGKEEKRKRKKRKKGGDWSANAGQMWIYVSQLPLDISVEEVKAHFSKVGLIAINPADQQPKIKLYTDDTGAPKGDCSICYVAQSSVEMAVDVLHGGFIRASCRKPIDVQKAEFQRREDFHPDWRKTRPSVSRNQVKVVQSVVAQALAWNNEDDSGVSKRKAVKIVVVEGMFEPQDFEDPTFSDTLEQDVATECGKCGEILKITVYSKNSRGPVIVKFATSYAAQECIRLFDGRFYAGRKLRCFFWDGKTNYDVSSEGGDGANTTAVEDKRLDEFGDWLENEQQVLPDEFKLRVE